MKSFVKYFLLIALSLSLILTFISCGDVDDVCTEHKDDDSDGHCDICTAPVEKDPPSCEHRDEDADYVCDICFCDFFPECYDHINENGNTRCDICGEILPISITVKMLDQEGTALVGIKFTLRDADYEEYEGITDKNGEAGFSLLPGNYYVSYDETTVPEGYIAYSSSLTVREDSTVIELEMLNNIPDGTEARPFVVDSELEESVVSLLGGEKYFYIVPHGGSRIVTYIGEEYEIVYYERLESGYNPKVYTPDADGKITFSFTESDIKTPSLFTIENKASNAASITVQLKSLPGTMAKPYEITDITNPTLCEGKASSSVYYKWIATENGTLKLSSGEVVYSIRIGSTDAVILAKADGTEGLLGTYSAATPEGDLTLEFFLDLIVVRSSSVAAIPEGQEYGYELDDNGKLKIKDAQTGELIEPFSISPAGRVIVATNNRNSNQQSISENQTELYINVLSGDEIIISVHTAFDMNVNIKFEY